MLLFITSKSFLTASLIQSTSLTV